jgi:hemolysin activation/secretion protein
MSARLFSIYILFIAFAFFTSRAMAGVEPETDGPYISGGVVNTDVYLYPVNMIELSYSRPHPEHISSDKLKDITVDLVIRDHVFMTEDEIADQTEVVTIGHISKSYGLLSVGAIQKISESILEYFSERGFAGVYVLPHPEDISLAGQDLREPANKKMRFVIFTSTVGELKTFAYGPRFEGLKPVEKQDFPGHEWIKQGSPLKTAEYKKNQYNDLLQKEITDEYIHRLNRHPGRMTSVVIGAGEEPGEATLEYRITESRPWVAYAQLTDTGTGNTADWQKRFGFIHNQLTGHDDIFSLDFLTAGFGDYSSLLFSYDAPWLWDQLSDWRLALKGNFSEFTASDVGVPDASFTGKTGVLGLEIVNAFRQYGEWFLDLSAGLEWKDIEVDNDFARIKGNENFFKPVISAFLERKKRTVNTSAKLELESNLAGIAGTDSKDLPDLGRADTDARWLLAKLSFLHSFFLEPLFFGDDFWDPSSPESSTMAHEVRLNARAQAVLDDSRLIPQEKMVLGGLYSVRGYPQSIASGDSAIMGSMEYRLHLPRLLPLNPDPSSSLFGDSFRMAPTQVYSYPDWDLVFKLFSDIGYTHNNDRIFGLEENETLWSLGAGLELQLRRNLRVQLDYGHAMLGLNGDVADEGDSEIHLEITFFH